MTTMTGLLIISMRSPVRARISTAVSKESKSLEFLQSRSWSVLSLRWLFSSKPYLYFHFVSCHTNLLLLYSAVTLTAYTFPRSHRFVYLKPNYTTKVNNALTDCRIRIQGSKWSGGSDLAAGAGGDYRYLQFNKDTDNFNKYESAALLRRAGNPASIKDAPGFNVLTTDINKHRNGDYLYVAFRQREVFEVEKIKT